MKSRVSRSRILVKQERRTSFLSNSINSVCIDRPVGGIGDVLMATVAMREFKRENPKVKLTVAIDRSTTYDDTYYKLIANAPFIDEIIDSRYTIKEKYDRYYNIKSVCIQRENSRHANLNRIDIFAKACNVVKIENFLPFYKETEEEKKKADKAFLVYEDKKKFFIHTASNEGKRSYSKLNMINLVKLISSTYKNSVIFVSDFNNIWSEWDTIENVVNVSELNIRQCASYIKRSDFFIGPDSGLMHLAGALGTKSLVIFGSIPPSVRINRYPTHEAIRMEELDCLECWYKECPFGIKCMKDLKPKAILKRIKEII